MPFDRIFLDELSARNDIVEIVSQYVQLKKSGANYFGLCPFHNEKTGSFSVSPDKQIFHCFGCGAGGGVITFIMKAEGLTFPDAVRYLAERAGMQIPEQGEAERKAARHRERLYALCRDAGRYYYDTLWRPENRTAQQYFINRGLSRRTMNRFGLGYAPDSFHALIDAMTAKGYTREELMDAGLVSRSEKGHIYDRFRNRVMFPIIDVRGHVIAFGGRVLDDSKPKYLNSPETPIFHKSRNLFALNLSKSTKNDYFILAEGYMDVISMHQAGFNNAVASLGTALTSLQAGLMKRYTDEVLVIYDSDEAGVKAALRAIPMLKGVGLTTRVVNLRPYKDPDEFIQHEGCEAFEKRLEEAENSVLYEIRMKERDFDLADPQGKSDFLHEAVRRLVAIEDEIERNSYLEAVAGKYGIAVEVLRKQVGQMALSGAGRTERVKPRNTAANKKEKEGGVEKAQKLMLTWMTSYPALIGKLEKYITPEDFTTPLYRQIAEMIVLQYHEGGVNPAKLLNQFVDSEEQKEVAGLFNARIPLETEEEKRRALHDVICNMKENSIAYQSAHMNVTDMAALQKLMADKKSLERWKAGELPDFAF